MTSRLPPQPGEWIDRRRPIRFRFEGRNYEGFAGDTISTALWASGRRVLGRSFKYHRPRGIFGLADIDSNVMMECAEGTNIRADVTPLREGLDLRAVNTLGGLDQDLLRFMDQFGAVTPVGFYYKAFHTPKELFPLYEKRIRGIAGLGAVNTRKRHRQTPKDYAFCDVLVVGAGPAGLEAVVAAADQGARVLLVDENPRLGGTLCFVSTSDEERRGILSSLLARVERHPNIEARTSTTAAGLYADHWVALVDNRRMTKLRAKAIVVATGCYEQPAVFRNNDLPGIMLGSAAQRLVGLYAARPFERGVVLTANPDGYQVALDLHRAGVRLLALADLREKGERSQLFKDVIDAGIPVHFGHTVIDVAPSWGKRSVRGVRIGAVDEQGNAAGDSFRRLFECDGIAVSVGWAPADGLLRQGRTRMEYSPECEQFVPSKLPPGLFAAGRVNGIYDLDSQREDGRHAGEEAARCIGKRGVGKEGAASGPRPERSGPPRSHPFPVTRDPRGKNFVDLDEDLQLKDLENAIREGFDNVELLKRYSTFGMGPSQGKHSNALALRILARARGETMAGKQVTTARPFTTPVPLSHLAGRIFTPVRRTPIHGRHEALGAKFMYAGNWLRPDYYRQPRRERAETVASEAKNVRDGVGLIDLGTLGKLEISGVDAVEFIERVYTGRFAKLKVGMSRYAVMCDETGVIIDDGVVARLAEDRFYVSTTTSGAEGVYRELQRWAIQWGLDVVLVNATNAYGAMNLAGPLSRQVIGPLTDVETGHEPFPYLGVREGNVAGVPARILRVGFVGELGYELHVPAEGALHVWDRLMEAGADSGIRAFGVEAQRLLRLEKAHIIVGQDTDGLTLPFEAGMAWAVKMQKTFFVGQRSLAVMQKKALMRCLVGFVLPPGYRGLVPKECHLIIDRGAIAGRVTSVSFSPTLGHVIGLAYVRPEQSQPGSRIFIRGDDSVMVEATVAETPFVDPENARQEPSEVLQEAS